MTIPTLLDSFVAPVLSKPYDQFVVALLVGLMTISQLSKVVSQLGRSGSMMAYGKFAAKVTEGWPIPSRWGMVALYLPAALQACALCCMDNRGSWIQHSSYGRGGLLAFLTSIHFAKRTLECLFLHKYSGTMPLLSSLTIAFCYFLMPMSAVHYSQLVSPSMLRSDLLTLGTHCFVVGLVGNGYHHLLLARLRSGSSKAYATPRGGLFEYVAAPHYLFEILTWLGLALVSQHQVMLLTFVSMGVYLGERAVAQSEFNRKNIKGYPKARGHIVPFVF